MKMLAANRLSDGEAVWLAADGNWVDEISHAETVRDKDGEERLLAAGRDATGRNEVVDAELVDVEIIDGFIRPIRLRERIRAAGPSIHPELGKQAKKSAVTLA